MCNSQISIESHLQLSDRRPIPMRSLWAKKIPAVASGRDVQAARQVEPDVPAGDSFDLAIQSRSSRDHSRSNADGRRSIFDAHEYFVGDPPDFAAATLAPRTAS